MLKRLHDLITWSGSDSQEEWETWFVWQENQLPSHFQCSDLYAYYISYRPDFVAPCNIPLNKIECYRHCFGDFTNLILIPNGSGDVLKYFITLIDFYDVCKGVSRRVLGDPICITTLRDALIRRSLDPLIKLNFSPYHYPYENLHAHTVAQYSLSTLIMTLISNYLSHITKNGTFIAISVIKCQESQRLNNYNNQKPLKSSPISISGLTVEPQRSSSWPNHHSQRCSVCDRLTERIYGQFNTCMDCHNKRICACCGVAAVVIGLDNLPRCHDHIKM